MIEDKIVNGVILGILLTIFCLRIFNVITWPWVWILAPLWIPLSLGIILVFIFIIIILLREVFIK